MYLKVTLHSALFQLFKFQNVLICPQSSVPWFGSPFPQYLENNISHESCVRLWICKLQCIGLGSIVKSVTHYIFYYISYNFFVWYEFINEQWLTGVLCLWSVMIHWPTSSRCRLFYEDQSRFLFQKSWETSAFKGDNQIIKYQNVTVSVSLIALFLFYHQ